MFHVFLNTQCIRPVVPVSIALFQNAKEILFGVKFSLGEEKLNIARKVQTELE